MKYRINNSYFVCVIIERQSDHEVLIPFSSAVGRDAVQEAEDQDEFLIEHSNTRTHAERPGETCTPYSY